MTRQYTTSPNYKVSAHKNGLKDWNLELRLLWIEYGHAEEIKQVENWRYEG